MPDAEHSAEHPVQPSPSNAPGEAKGPRQETRSDPRRALGTTVKQTFSIVGTVLGALAAVSAFTAPFARSGSELIWTSVAVLAAALLVTAIFVGVYTFRRKRIAPTAGILAGLLVLILATGTGLGYAVWHRTAASPSATSTPSAGASVPQPSATETLAVGVEPSGKLTYNEIAGVGCDSDENASAGSDPINPKHPWIQESADDWNAGPCTDQVLYSALTTEHNTDKWMNDYWWTFLHVPHGADCWFAVYIADSKHSEYAQTQYYASAAIGAPPPDPSFLINQGLERGVWVEEYSSPADTSTGTVQLLVTDAGSSAQGQSAGPTLTASVVRLQCVNKG